MGNATHKRRPSLGVTDEAIEKIKTMVVSGQLQPGERLPKEDELASLLGLSRSSLREAVRALELVHILDVRQGDGTYVTSLDPELLLDAMSFVIDFHRDDSVLHFLAVRRLLEPAAVALAAPSIADAQVVGLRQILAEVPPDASSEVFVLNDQDFHRAIVSHCGNPVLSSLLESMAGPIHRARVWRCLTEVGAHQRTLSEHLGIVEALQDHDADLAAARTAAHIAGVEDWLRRAR
jgi:GntR family transcriptional regulator, transcriptional repressor for pyruvate dehydrogenase complex